MPIYKISLARTIGPIISSYELRSISGKFLYFPKNTLIIDESEELFHKDIYTIAKNAQLVTEPPIGYGKIINGEIKSWISNYFGETPEDVKKTIANELELFPG
jgi:hypothetical protein